ncbi:MAG: site-specific DNA-methyltransferase [Polyangiaceae bacterium]|nr:site-specific DNA-methyltransferase [Polyangiaceae bacterium]
MTGKPEPPRRRRSLTHVGGEVAIAGDTTLAQMLARALAVEPAPEPRAEAAQDDDPDRQHVHGFHTYPARMHPATAAGLVRAVSAEGGVVLDPFCGSGTVLVEAMLASRQAVGTDLNPIAVRLARLKTTPANPAAREAIRAGAATVAELAADRRARRAGATRRYPPEDVAAFDPHVLLELDSLRAGIAEQASSAPVRSALELVLSAILVKVSRRRSDTSSGGAARRIAAGFPTRLFRRKADELARRLGDLADRLPPGARAARVELDDAVRLRSVGASTVDAVVTSPPYVATYDYLAHHALRLRWLGLDASALASGELGARRRYARKDARSAGDAWAGELSRALRALARVCRRNARVALLMADSAVGTSALRADAIVAAIAPSEGFAVLARASQIRPHFHEPTADAFRRTPRAEHAIVIEKR